MKIGETVIMSLLIAIVAFMLIYPFFIRHSDPAPRPVRRTRKAGVGGNRRMIPVSRTRKDDPRHRHRIRIIVRKIPLLRYWIRDNDDEAYPDR